MVLVKWFLNIHCYVSSFNVYAALVVCVVPCPFCTVVISATLEPAGDFTSETLCDRKPRGPGLLNWMREAEFFPSQKLKHKRLKRRRRRARGNSCCPRQYPCPTQNIYIYIWKCSTLLASSYHSLIIFEQESMKFELVGDRDPKHEEGGWKNKQKLS